MSSHAARRRLAGRERTGLGEELGVVHNTRTNVGKHAHWRELTTTNMKATAMMVRTRMPAHISADRHPGLSSVGLRLPSSAEPCPGLGGGTRMAARVGAGGDDGAGVRAGELTALHSSGSLYCVATEMEREMTVKPVARFLFWGKEPLSSSRPEYLSLRRRKEC